MSRNSSPHQPEGESLSPKDARIKLQRCIDKGRELSQKQPFSKERYSVWYTNTFKALEEIFGKNSGHLYPSVSKNLSSNEVKAWEAASPQDRLWFVWLKLLTLMKKYLVLIATVSLILGACERHPASQLPTEGEGVAKERSGATQEKQTTPEPSPSGTPKTYFPQNS